MTILTSPLFPQLAPYFTITNASRGDSAKQRVRIELSAMPMPLYLEAIALTMPCVECGRAIHPIRSRRGPPKRATATSLCSGLYFAAACPLGVSISCSRGDAASSEYARVRKHFEQPEQMALGVA